MDMKITVVEHRHDEELPTAKNCSERASVFERQRFEWPLIKKRKAEKLVILYHSIRIFVFEHQSFPKRISSFSKIVRLRPRNIIPKDVTATLDKTKTSNQNVVFPLVIVVKGPGHNPDRMFLNCWINDFRQRR